MIESPRLIFRPWLPDDDASLFRYASDPQVSEMAMWPTHTSVEMSRMVIEQVFMPNPDCFAMVLKATGEPVGCIGLVPQGHEHCSPATDEREIGYWIGRPLWGNGLTTEAMEALMTHYRAAGYPKSLLLTTDRHNKASQRVARKCHFEPIGEIDIDGTPGLAFRRHL